MKGEGRSIDRMLQSWGARGALGMHTQSKPNRGASKKRGASSVDRARRRIAVSRRWIVQARGRGVVWSFVLLGETCRNPKAPGLWSQFDSSI